MFRHNCRPCGRLLSEVMPIEIRIGAELVTLHSEINTLYGNANWMAAHVSERQSESIGYVLATEIKNAEKMERYLCPESRPAGNLAWEDAAIMHRPLNELTHSALGAPVQGGKANLATEGVAVGSPRRLQVKPVI